VATALTVAIGVLAFVLVVPSIVLLVECVASLFPIRRRMEQLGPSTRTAILIPAHDESASIEGTVSALSREIGPRDRIVVIADNCSDDTADLAIASGATAIRRHDPERRGKGHALRFGVEWLESDPPDVVVVVDADCRLDRGSLSILAGQASSLGRPVQAEYVFTPAVRTPLSMISTLALLVRNRVRPRGLRRLGLPCQLTGSGMAFPWSVLRDAPPLGSNLVEDLLLGIELAKTGTPPFHSIEAQVTSALPTGRGAAMQQRRRWEHGQLATLLRHGPALMLTGIGRRDPALFALGADLVVPPLALLVGLSTLSSIAALALWAWAGSTWPLVLGLAAIGSVVLGVGFGWVRFGRTIVPFRYLLAAPIYLLWKAPLYLSFAFGRRERRWRRTER
jgi:cellulose synthase/poly-beta-1,6-N-acetylglucosamine synthase-like glycosyltransferase